MPGPMVINDLAESSFAGVTAQVQTYGCIGMCNAAAVSDMACNDFLTRPTTAKDIANGNGPKLFHGMSEELQISLLETFIEDAPAVKLANSNILELKCKKGRRRKW